MSIPQEDPYRRTRNLRYAPTRDLAMHFIETNFRISIACLKIVPAKIGDFPSRGGKHIADAVVIVSELFSVPIVYVVPAEPSDLLASAQDVVSYHLYH